ncbi:MAG: 1-deoxy-D-xylulose-5-phosphate synthase [Lachnospiraceae bacterium]|nr:1-deoxy-D-xylulose-5-phosphate synthase [Lachnospiraceae bacterium]
MADFEKYRILPFIKKENDIKNIDKADWPVLASEIRDFLVRSISETGGHLGSNLGVVELTMALHLSLDLPSDKIIFDVGHQSYTHKILTGRKEGFDNLRRYGGMSGFPKRAESPCDCFNTGHSSTSLSAALGMVKARELAGEKNTIVAVIGDGSLTGGMAYEALDNMSKLESNLIIIVNDNDMSISENVGGMSQYLNDIRTKESYLDLKDSIYLSLAKTKSGEGLAEKIRAIKSGIKQLVIPGMYFENMGITYLGPVNGHDINAMMQAIKEAKRVKKAVIIHAVTKKGKGYGPAENHPARFHGAEPFEIETGIPKNIRTKANYTDVFSTVMCKIAEDNKSVVGITAAMAEGTGFKRFRNKYPDRFFDVGIAEEHAVTFAAGMAVGGFIPVVAIYSSFIQRAYDQILHDVCLQQLPVVFAIDRAGIVGSDGETHQGIFDLSFLSSIPGMTLMAPKNKWELADMLKYAIRLKKPVAIRYPRGTAYDGLQDYRARIETGRAEIIYDEPDKKKGVCLVAVGSMVKTAEAVRDMLKEKGIKVSLINARFVKPFDKETISEAAKNTKVLVTMEENVITGGFGEQVLEELNDRGITPEHFINISIPDRFVEHGNCDILKKVVGIDADTVFKKITDVLK